MSSQTYSEKLRDPRWQKKRLEIMGRDGFKCRDCGGSEKTLHVHHCCYAGDPWNAPDEVLLTLCESCHDGRQYLENEIRMSLGVIMARMGNGKDDEQLAALHGAFYYFSTHPEIAVRLCSDDEVCALHERVAALPG